MKCKDIGCENYQEYTANGKIKRRCVINGKKYLLGESETLPLWCPRALDPIIKQLIDRQNRMRRSE